MRATSPEKSPSVLRRFSDEFYDEDEQLSRLFEACCQRDRATSVSEVLSANEQWVHVNSKGGYGDTGLHYAAKYNNCDGAKLLLAKGAHVDALNFLNVTPLDKAAALGHLDVMRLLIAAGANLEHQDDIAGTPLMTAIKRDQPDAAALLLRRGAKPCACDAGGNTALHFAASEGLLSCVSVLLQYGGDPKMINARGLTPLDLGLRSWGDSLMKDKLRAMLSMQENNSHLGRRTQEQIVA